MHNANGGGLSGSGSGGTATIPAMPPSALSTLSPSALASTGRDLSSADPIAELLSQVRMFNPETAENNRKILAKIPKILM